jgi:hypothetical protein
LHFVTSYERHCPAGIQAQWFLGIPIVFVRRRSNPRRSPPGSSIIFCHAADDFEGTLVTIDGDDVQRTLLAEPGQNHCSFKSCDFGFSAIALQDIPLSQNIDRDSCSIYTFPVLQHVFKVTPGNVSLRHPKNSMLRKNERRTASFRACLRQISWIAVIRNHVRVRNLYHVQSPTFLAESFQMGEIWQPFLPYPGQHRLSARTLTPNPL